MSAPRTGPFDSERIIRICALSAFHTGGFGFFAAFFAEDHSFTALCAVVACIGATTNSVFIGVIAHRLRGVGAG